MSRVSLQFSDFVNGTYGDCNDLWKSCLLDLKALFVVYSAMSLALIECGLMQLSLLFDIRNATEAEHFNQQIRLQFNNRSSTLMNGNVTSHLVNFTTQSIFQCGSDDWRPTCAVGASSTATSGAVAIAAIVVFAVIVSVGAILSIYNQYSFRKSHQRLPWLTIYDIDSKDTDAMIDILRRTETSRTQQRNASMSAKQRALSQNKGSPNAMESSFLLPPPQNSDNTTTTTTTTTAMITVTGATAASAGHGDEEPKPPSLKMNLRVIAEHYSTLDNTFDMATLSAANKTGLLLSSSPSSPSDERE